MSMLLKTVLIEDSGLIRENLIPALAEFASARIVGIAETANDAIDVLHELGNGWDLAVVDLFLRDGSGLSVLRAFQNRGKHQRMVVLTNYPTNEMRRASQILGADALFDKSNELESFFSWVSNAKHLTSTEEVQYVASWQDEPAMYGVQVYQKL